MVAKSKRLFFRVGFPLRLLTFVLFTASFGCAPTAPPFRPGYIPQERYLSARDEQYGHQVLASLMREFPLERNDAVIARVRSIADRITRMGVGSRNPWHVYVLQSNRVKNAAATRGNHLFVWTALLTTLRDDAEVATVISHEIAHVLAGHTDDDPNAESAKILGQVMGEATSQILGVYGGVAPIVGSIAGSLISTGVDAAINNPRQQQREFDADQIGLNLMAKSGYDPRTAVRLWERLQYDPDFSNQLPSFLSTHPSSKNRLERLNDYLPDALRIYDQARFDRSTQRSSDRSTDWTIP